MSDDEVMVRVLSAVCLRCGEPGSLFPSLARWDLVFMDRRLPFVASRADVKEAAQVSHDQLTGPCYGQMQLTVEALQ